jgi:enterochelin esterase-like enzyme
MSRILGAVLVAAIAQLGAALAVAQTPTTTQRSPGSQAPASPTARPPPGGLTFPTVPVPAQLAGKLERVKVHGESLVGNLSGDSPDRDVSVYLPPSYARQPQRRYPVMYLLHGFTDSDVYWFGVGGQQHFVNVPGAVDRANASGARELIVVMPNAFTKFAGSMYSSSAAIGDWEAFVAKDLVAYVDGHYRTLPKRASRGLAGHSMGGYGTLRIGMKYPETFSSLYSMSPCCMAASLSPSLEQFAGALQVKTDADVAALARTDFGTKAMLASAAAWSANPKKPPLYLDLPVADGKVLPDVVARWAANAPLALVHQYLPQLRGYAALALDAGDMDFGIVDTVRTLDRILGDYGIEHSAEVYQGDHVNRVDQRLETKVLPFFSAHLAFE